MLALLALLLAGCTGAAIRPPPRDALADRGWRRSVPPPRTRAATNGPPGEIVSRQGPGKASRGRHARRTVLSHARSQVGQRRVRIGGQSYRSDCSGLVCGLYEEAGVDLFSDGAIGRRENGVSIIYRYVRDRGGLHRGPPRPGDLAFFDDTYDRNGDGRTNDRLTHIGVVESVELDGTVVIIHHGSKGTARARLNLDRPGTHRDPETGEVINDYLRAAPRGPRLAGELFAGYGSVVP